jgi:hypothetical protein
MNQITRGNAKKKRERESQRKSTLDCGRSNKRWSPMYLPPNNETEFRSSAVIACHHNEVFLFAAEGIVGTLA